jgi:mono/diheme cytochrome c family protein
MENIVPSPTPPSRAARLIAVLSLTALLVACSSAGRPESTLADHMQAHLSLVGDMQSAIIQGDLAAARQAGLRIAEHPEHQDLPRGIENPIEDVRAFSRSVSRAASIQDAARYAAEIGAACGRCHRAAEASLGMETGVMPPAEAATGTHMRRHAWATDRLWEGLIVPSDRLWEAGAVALTDDPIFLPDDAAGQETNALAREIHDLGTEARRVEDPAMRSGIFGRTLGTCARCHTLEGITIG